MGDIILEPSLSTKWINLAIGCGQETPFPFVLIGVRLKPEIFLRFHSWLENGRECQIGFDDFPRIKSLWRLENGKSAYVRSFLRASGWKPEISLRFYTGLRRGLEWPYRRLRLSPYKIPLAIGKWQERLFPLVLGAIGRKPDVSLRFHSWLRQAIG
jgi:hypothetical protein